MGSIYSITNSINNKKYIGKTEYSDPIKRWKEHIKDSKKERNRDRPIYRAMKKYGIENFSFDILFEDISGEELSNKEIEVIAYMGTIKKGYNATLGGDGASYLNLSDKDVVEKYKEINNIADVSKFFNCSRKTISEILKRNNIDSSNPTYNKNTNVRFVSKKIRNVTKNLEFNTITDASNYLIINGLTETKNFQSVRKCIGKAIHGRLKSYLGDIWITL